MVKELANKKRVLILLRFFKKLTYIYAMQLACPKRSLTALCGKKRMSFNRRWELTLHQFRIKRKVPPPEEPRNEKDKTLVIYYDLVYKHRYNKEKRFTCYETYTRKGLALMWLDESQHGQNDQEAIEILRQEVLDELKAFMNDAANMARNPPKISEKVPQYLREYFPEEINKLFPGKSSNTTSTNKVKNRLYEKQKGVCKGCGEEFPKHRMEVDHIAPVAKGGAHAESNYQLLCGPCNSSKGDRSMADFLRSKS